MSSRARQILEDALELPEEDRLLIAAELKQSVGNSGSPENVEAAWREEVGRRLRSLEDGSAVLHDWDDVERELLDIVRN